MNSRRVLIALALVLGTAACGGGKSTSASRAAVTSSSSSSSSSSVVDTTSSSSRTTGAPATAATTTKAPAPAPATRFRIENVATGLDTVWAMAFDRDGTLVWTERPGTITRLGGSPQKVAGVAEAGEGGLMGLVIDGQGRRIVMYTSASDNRVVRIEPDGKQTVLLQGIAKAGNHDGGRMLLRPDGTVLVSTGDAGLPNAPEDPNNLNGKVLSLPVGGGPATVFSRGHRNVQGICQDTTGRVYITEHGPDFGDEVGLLVKGSDGGWPGTAGNSDKNYTPTIAPAGCVIYSGSAFAWRGSILFVTLKDSSLRRVGIGADGRVTGSEQILIKGDLGRLRDIAVGPDGTVYLATSNKDGRGSPRTGDDRIVKLVPIR